VLDEAQAGALSPPLVRAFQVAASPEAASTRPSSSSPSTASTPRVSGAAPSQALEIELRVVNEVVDWARAIPTTLAFDEGPVFPES